MPRIGPKKPGSRSVAKTPLRDDTLSEPEQKREARSAYNEGSQGGGLDPAFDPCRIAEAFANDRGVKLITPTERNRVEVAIAAMYRRPWLSTAALIEEAAAMGRCSRRQLERAFDQFEVGAAQELRAIRCELAAACLVDPDWRDKSEGVIARRVGLSDARALRRVTAARWGIAPGGIREAAWLHRHLRWAEARAESRHARWGRELGEDSYAEGIRGSLKASLEGAPIEIRRLAEGEVRYPLPTRAAAKARGLAAERVACRWRGLVHEAGLVA